ncbi:MAG: hypothetical protein ABI882_16295 [Acidobacteriota bacterium]
MMPILPSQSSESCFVNPILRKLTLDHADALRDELQNFRRKIFDAGRGNDDLVFALSLCTWAAGSYVDELGGVSADIQLMFTLALSF